MRISDWSSDVCSSDLLVSTRVSTAAAGIRRKLSWRWTGLEFCDLFSQLCCESAPDSCSLRRIFLHLATLPLKIGRTGLHQEPGDRAGRPARRDPALLWLRSQGAGCAHHVAELRPPEPQGRRAPPQRGAHPGHHPAVSLRELEPSAK